MKKTTITEEEFIKNNYPYCFRCLNFRRYYSSIYGDANDCLKDRDINEIQKNFHDNFKNLKENKNLIINNCDCYEFGEPQVQIKN